MPPSSSPVLSPPCCKVPVQARLRSDKHAAVLRLQNTQPKDRRFYTAFTGILAARTAGQKAPDREGTGQAKRMAAQDIRRLHNFSYYNIYVSRLKAEAETGIIRRAETVTGHGVNSNQKQDIYKSTAKYYRVKG